MENRNIKPKSNAYLYYNMTDTINTFFDDKQDISSLMRICNPVKSKFDLWFCVCLYIRFYAGGHNG